MLGGGWGGRGVEAESQGATGGEEESEGGV